MKIKARLWIGISLIFCLVGFTWVQYKTTQVWPEPVYNFKKNPLAAEKIALGRKLFYDPILSQDSTISCASCHSPFSAFTHVDHALSHGIHDSIGKRNSPALMNLAWQKNFMWDGAINHLDVQALAPISNTAEMGSDLKTVVTKLNQSTQYQSLFLTAFNTQKVTGEVVLKALSQFMLTLISNQSKYDQVIAQKATFTEQEQRGYSLFQKNCNHCHQEPLFSNYKFANNGLPVNFQLNDFGKMNWTQNKSDSLLFKTPTLRNIAYTYPYMHDGRFKKLSDVLDHYQHGIQQSSTLSPELRKPMRLTAENKVDIIAFLLTLSDKSFVLNPQFSFPKK
jgi:cytochrome c peroxidase